MATGGQYAIEDKQQTIPATMLAAVYRGVNDVRMETVPVPRIGPGELLVRVHTCGVCGTDLKKIATGSHSAPRIFGHETAGMVAAVGAGVRDFQPGDRVVVFHHIPCGDCYYCRNKTFAQCETYKKVGCTAGFEPSGGGFAEYVRVMDWIVAARHRSDPGKCFFRAGVFCRAHQYLHEGNRKIGITHRRDGCSNRSRSHRYHVECIGQTGRLHRSHFRFVSPKAYNIYKLRLGEQH